MEKNKYNQAKCEDCSSWHFAINLDDKGTIKEIKCCRCGKIEEYEPKLNLFLDKKGETKGKLSRDEEK